MSTKVKRVETASAGLPPAPRPRGQQQCKLLLLPKQSSSDPTTADKLARYQKLLPGFPFAAKTSSSGSRSSFCKKASNDETAAELRMFFEAIMTGHPNQAAYGSDTMSLVRSYATTSHRQRSEIYAINKILRAAELEKFHQFMEKKGSPQTSHDISLSDESDSDNSCINSGSVRRSSGKSSKSKALTSATILAAALRTQASEQKRVKAKSMRGNFGGV